MANYVAGHVNDPDAMDSCIGIEFEPENNQAVAYINEEELALSYEQVRQLETMCSQVARAMEWHIATWIYAKTMFSGETYHLMKKGEHDPKGKTLCGRLPRTESFMDKWDLAPVIKEPWRTHSTCKRCLAAYDKRVKEVQS